ncbi:Hypothetical predicted protein [Marmota monax]|uniref:non-specific serine/threonine protein kinase n=1 Tax=Marmota monax TaxID=9995 RepID=A0A5E4B6Q5_MARMO|nr:Hypothetical predicted protein [Marmota monax]
MPIDPADAQAWEVGASVPHPTDLRLQWEWGATKLAALPRTQYPSGIIILSLYEAWVVPEGPGVPIPVEEEDELEYPLPRRWDSDNIYLIMEFCAGGDLSRFIHTRRILPEKVARVFMQQLASALQFLHERNISHLDLKPQNILLSSLEKPHLKLAGLNLEQQW